MNAISFAKVKRRISSGVFTLDHCWHHQQQEGETDSSDDRKSIASEHSANRIGDGKGAAGSGSKNFARSGGRDHRAACARWNASEKGRPPCENQTRFVQGARRTAGSRDQRSEGDEFATESDAAENGARFQARRRFV